MTHDCHLHSTALILTSTLASPLALTKMALSRPVEYAATAAFHCIVGQEDG